ncbi:alpha-amylase [Clostridia bacterium]|nr:alpha-amylase [Clostridia bacterium]
MKAYHNSQESAFRTPFGAVAVGTEVTLRIKIEGKVDGVDLRLWSDGEEIIHKMSKTRGKMYEVKITAEKPMLLWYFFIIHQDSSKCYYGSNMQLSDDEPDSFQITIYKEDYKTPRWFQKSVVYQIFVDRFYNGNKDKKILKKHEDYILHKHWNEPVSSANAHNDFYGGNLQGIIEKLDYFVDLGVNVLYLNPIFEAYSNHKYDTGDYTKIDPMYGDEKIFKNLCKQAKKRNISIVLDGVFNHTGSDSKYFNKYGHYDSVGAYQSTESPYHNWYRFEEFPNKYECWWGVHSLPQVNEENEDYVNYIIKNEDSVIKHWLKAGARGWRLDVVDELPSLFVKNIRQAVKELDKDNVLIGEVWEDASNKISYGVQREYLLGDELDGPLNYPFKDLINGFIIGLIDAEIVSTTVNKIRENYPAQSLYSAMNLIGGHDVVRIKTLYSNGQTDIDSEEISRKRVKLAALWQMTFMGVPTIYYGDEVGLEGAADPYNRAPYPWNNSDIELYDWYRTLIKLRNSTPALQTGYFEEVKSSGDVYSYKRYIKNGKDAFGRKAEDGEYLIVLNRKNITGKIYKIEKGKKHECI